MSLTERMSVEKEKKEEEEEELKGKGRKGEEEKGGEKTETPELTNWNVSECQEQKSSQLLQDFGKDD